LAAGCAGGWPAHPVTAASNASKTTRCLIQIGLHCSDAAWLRLVPVTCSLFMDPAVQRP
jgi:hypothetical protein